MIRFLVFSSNIFAILGLRSMYFFLANAGKIQLFRIQCYLSFVGLKMLLHEIMPEWVSLAFIALSLITGIVVSLRKASKDTIKFKNK
jgi:tellurite resistance protein TerC